MREDKIELCAVRGFGSRKEDTGAEKRNVRAYIPSSLFMVVALELIRLVFGAHGWCASALRHLPFGKKGRLSGLAALVTEEY